MLSSGPFSQPVSIRCGFHDAEMGKLTEYKELEDVHYLVRHGDIKSLSQVVPDSVLGNGQQKIIPSRTLLV